MEEFMEASRPKIHRLPEPQEMDDDTYVSRTVLIICLVLLLAAIIPALWSYAKLGKQKSAQTMLEEQAQQLISPPRDPAMAIIDEQGRMLGQFAKMPGDQERKDPIQSSSTMDPQTGEQLMRIISKDR